MATGGGDAGLATRRGRGGSPPERRAPRPVVAVRRRHHAVRRRVGVAPAARPSMMKGRLWERLARVLGVSGREGRAERTEAERILLEADFGVEATEEILDALS